MTRFIQDGANEKPPKEKKIDIPTKAGEKDFDYMELSSIRKIPTKGGFV